ncbi:MAG: hypothetical protein C4K58_06025 [Flavobacteriaceae bacterium]|nr:MAG: hypothetical protein C4K58_06025 [Flavobacteriaceae bacterium]
MKFKVCKNTLMNKALSFLLIVLFLASCKTSKVSTTTPETISNQQVDQNRSYMYSGEKLVVEKSMYQMVEHLARREFEEFTGYILPEVFKFVSKEKLISEMHETFNDPELKMEVKNPTVSYVSDIQTIDGKKYAVLEYAYTISTAPESFVGETKFEKISVGVFNEDRQNWTFIDAENNKPRALSIFLIPNEVLDQVEELSAK